MRNHLIAAMERLNDETASPEQISHEIERARALAALGKVLVESGKAEVAFLRHRPAMEDDGTGFIGQIKRIGP